MSLHCSSVTVHNPFVGDDLQLQFIHFVCQRPNTGKEKCWIEPDNEELA